MNAPTSTPLDYLDRHRGVLAVLLAAAAVRSSDLAAWWLNPDEGIYYSIVTRADFAGFWQEVTSNAHPPLYYLLLRVLGAVTWDFFWLRVFSLLCGVAAVAGAWAVTRRLTGEGSRGTAAGFLAALVLAFAPGAVELSQVMRPYMLQLALLSWALFFLIRHADGTDGAGSPHDLAVYVALLCLGLLVHYSSVLALGALMLLVASEGLDGGIRSRGWRRLAAVHAIPVALVALLYVVHLRPLAGTALADDALAGWLGFYMIDAPADVWWSFLGLQHLLAHPWLRGPMALFLAAAVALALYAGERRIAVLAGGALLVAIVVASAGLYPLGATRHSTWLLAFTVPALGWLGASLLDTPPGGRTGVRLGVPLLLIAAGGPVGSALGMAHAPWAPADRVLRQEDLGRMVDVLDPTADPELVVMSAQTFYLLLPFYPAEREEAVFSADSGAFHFPYGERRILVSRAWDFTMAASGAGPAGDFAAFLRSADRAFPELDVTGRDRLLLLVGGWRPAFVDELLAASRGEPFIGSTSSAPGLWAFELDVEKLVRAPSG